MPKFVTAFNRDEFPATMAGLVCETASQTLQEFRDEADINLLVNRYKNTGSFYNPLNPPAGERRMPEFLDCTEVPDLMEAQKMVAEAQRLFEALPAAARDWCGHSPAALLAAWHNPQLRPTVEALMSGKSGVQGIQSPANAVNSPDAPTPPPSGQGNAAGSTPVTDSASTAMGGVQK